MGFDDRDWYRDDYLRRDLDGSRLSRPIRRRQARPFRAPSVEVMRWSGTRRPIMFPDMPRWRARLLAAEVSFLAAFCAFAATGWVLTEAGYPLVP